MFVNRSMINLQKYRGADKDNGLNKDDLHTKRNERNKIQLHIRTGDEGKKAHTKNINHMDSQKTGSGIRSSVSVTMSCSSSGIINELVLQ